MTEISTLKDAFYLTVYVTVTNMFYCVLPYIRVDYQISSDVNNRQLKVHE